MPKYVKIWLLTMLVMVSAVVFCGCGMRTVDQLYCLPKRSEADNDLVAVIDEAMDGLSFSTPMYGENRLTVQAADLDGDEVDEYVVFARDNSEKPLKILIFCQLASGYVLMDTIEGYGLAFDFVEYAQVDDRPGVEIIVGRQLSDRVARSLSVYRFTSGFSRQLLSTGYSRVSTCDLDQDGRNEIFLLNYSGADNGNGLVNLFRYHDGELVRSFEQGLSHSAESFARFTEGTLSDGTSAMFVTCQSDENTLITDVFCMEDGQLRTVTGGVLSHSLQGYYVYPTDVDGDGLLEMAKLVTVSTAGSMRPLYLLQWYTLDVNGQQTMKQCTFHNYEDGWFIEVNAQQMEGVVVEQTESVTIFSLKKGQNNVTLVTIRSFTDADRETQAKQEDRVILYKSDAVIFTAEITPEAEALGVTAQMLTEAFHPIRAELMTEED